MISVVQVARVLPRESAAEGEFMCEVAPARVAPYPPPSHWKCPQTMSAPPPPPSSGTQSPLLVSNKKDYQRVLASHDQLFLKVEASMRRCQKAEMEREVAAKGRDKIERELEVTKQ